MLLPITLRCLSTTWLDCLLEKYSIVAFPAVDPIVAFNFLALKTISYPYSEWTVV
jgi:hypothetical protein